MKKLTVEISYDNSSSCLTAFDVKCAMENIFGLNTSFTVMPLQPSRRPYKRNGVRITKSFPLSYCLANAQNPGGQALSKNISPSGIKILANTFLSPLNHVVIHIPFPEEAAAIGARVVWCLERNDSRGFDAGLKFLNIDENTQKKISYLLKQ